MIIHNTGDLCRRFTTPFMRQLYLDVVRNNLDEKDGARYIAWELAKRVEELEAEKNSAG